MELSVVYVTLGGGTMPVTEGKLVVVPHTAWKFVLHACHVLGPGNVRKGWQDKSQPLLPSALHAV